MPMKIRKCEATTSYSNCFIVLGTKTQMSIKTPQRKTDNMTYSYSSLSDCT